MGRWGECVDFAEATGISDDMTREMARLMKSEGNAYEMDSKLIVRFYLGSILNQGKTLTAGRPVHDDLEKIRILKIGERDYIDKGANPEYIRRFQKQYDAFKRGEEARQSGTPLSMWPVLKESQVKDFAALNVHTMEQLASIADTVAQKFMGGFALRAAAQEYISRSASQAPIVAMQALMDEKDAKLAALTVQMQQMSAVLSEIQNRGAPQAAFAPSAPGLAAYQGPEFPVAPDAPAHAPTEAQARDAQKKLNAIMSGQAPRRRGRPPKSAHAE